MAGALKKQLLVAWCAALLPPHMGYAAPPTEYEVKAAFIHNIAKFVEWPATSPASGDARLCIAGKDPFGGALDVLQGKPIGDMRWEIVQVNPGPGLKECRMLFIATAERAKLGSILERIGNSPVLTVGDTEGYAEQGVMVNFYMEESKVRFEINQKAAKQAGLKISSRLLRLARVVRQREGEK